MERTPISPTTLEELEESTGYRYWRNASPNEIVFPGRRYSLKQATETLKRSIASERTLRFYSYVSENLADFAVAANCQARLGNRSEQARLSALAAVAHSLTPYLKPGQTIGALEPLNRAAGVWGVLALKKIFNSPELLVVQQRPQGRWQILKNLSIKEDTDNIHLTSRTGDLIVVQDGVGGSWRPTTANEYRWQSGKLVTTLSVFSEYGVRIEKFGRYWTLRTFRCIGNLSHADQPYWPSVYEKRNGQWRAADQRYPELFRDVYALLKLRCKQFPRESELPAYLNWTKKLLNGERVGPPPKENKTYE